MRLISTKIISISILLICNIIYAQEINRVIYKKKSNFNLDNKKSSNKNAAATLLIEKAMSAMDNLEYKLLFNKESSKFSEIESMGIDNGNSTISTIMSKSFGDTEGVFYSNIKEQTLLNQKELDGRFFLIKTKFSDFNWDVTSVQKKIGSFNCYKAIRTYLRATVSGERRMTVIAWFTPKIPYPFGPAGYLGLPGLVMEVDVDNIIIYASKISLNQKEKKDITIPKKGKIISLKEYNDLEKKGFKNFRKF